MLLFAAILPPTCRRHFTRAIYAAHVFFRFILF